MNTKSILKITGFVVIFLYGCGSSEQPNQTQQGQPQTRPATLVKTQPVQLHDLNEVLELPGTLEPENIANVLSTTEGKITRMDVRQGDKVKEGQVLAMLSPLLREDIINAARLNLLEKEAAAEKNPDDKTLNQDLLQARSDYEFALRQYREIPVIAPVNGIVSDRWVDMGDMVAARHKMFEIHSNKQLLVKVPVSELDIRKLQIGQNARISSDAC
ncbi:MAG: HlyD family efflux transporter periplasmic adaptor subunit, partial [Bacteroidetes bacterium]